MIRFTKVIVDNKLIYQGGSYNNIKHGHWIDNWLNKPKITFFIK